MEIIDVKHIILESKAEMCIYGLLNLKQNGIDLSFSNKHGQENKKMKNKKYYAIKAVPNPTGNLRNILRQNR